MYYVNPHIKNLKRVFPDENRLHYLRLDMNENPDGLPEDILKEVFDDITPQFLSMYPELGSLTHKIANHLEVDTNQIAVTSGSDMAIRYIFETFAERGSSVITVFPSFEMYSVYCKMYGLNQKKINYDKNFNIDIDEIINSIDEKTDLVVLLNPNNPIGNVYLEEEVKRIIYKANDVGAIVIIDEAYHYFYSKTYLNYVNDFNNVIILRTFSKLCSIASCRVGFIVSNIDIINNIKKVKSTFEVNGIGIKFAEKILDSNDLIQKLIDIEREGKDYIVEKLEAENYEYSIKNGNYVFIKTNNNPKVVFEKLKEKKILIKIYSYEILKDYIRVTTGSKNCMSQFLDEFLKIDKVKI